MPHLAVRNVTKIYPTGRRALWDVSFEAGAGVFGLLGPNGAGKSTLMRLLAGALDFEAGSIGLDDWDVRRHPREWRRRLGVMPQALDFVPHLSAMEYLEQCALMSGLSPRALRPRMKELLERVSLAEHAKRRGRDFSRGMKQRLAAAGAFLAEPSLVLLDEPTSGLDPRERIVFRDLLMALAKERLVLLSTHIVPDIERCCERLVVIHEGTVLYCGSTAELAASATGKVWELAATPDVATALESHRALVRLTPDGERSIARAVADTSPGDGARVVEPTLEDGYVLLVLRAREGQSARA